MKSLAKALISFTRILIQTKRKIISNFYLLSSNILENVQSMTK